MAKIVTYYMHDLYIHTYIVIESCIIEDTKYYVTD